MKQHLKEISIASVAFIILIILFTRPLAMKMETDLPFRELSGDGTVFVWNAWWMDQALSNGVSPFKTSLLFYPHSTNLTLHSMNWINSTLAALVAGPAQIIPAFNFVYLLSFLLAAMGMYLLIRQLRLSSIAAFTSGIAFAFTPYVMAHSLGHFNLTNIFPFPWFLFFLLRWKTYNPPSWKQFPLLIGTVLALLAAFYSDFNYFLFCMIILLIYIFVFYWKWIMVIKPRIKHKSFFKTLLTISICIGILLSIIIFITLTGGIDASIGKIEISMHSLKNPAQMLWFLIMLSGLLMFFKKHYLQSQHQIVTQVTHKQFLQIGISGLILIAGAWPLALQIIELLRNGDYIAPSIAWESGFSGADLLSYITPSPFHPIWGEIGMAIHKTFLLSISEKVLSPGFIILMMALSGYSEIPARLKKFLTILASLFFLISLGQHLHILGFNTWCVLPFQFFKLLPILDNTRVAARFGFVVIFVLIIFAAFGIDRLKRKRSSAWAILILVLVMIEVLPPPVNTIRPQMPLIYNFINKDLPGSSLLEIPFGRMDGLKKTGSFNTKSMYWQTKHGLPLLGGYIARIPDSYIRDIREDKVLSEIIEMQKGKTKVHLDESDVTEFRAKYNVGWVITAPGYYLRFHAFLIKEMGLEQRVRSEGYSIYSWPEISIKQ